VDWLRLGLVKSGCVGHIKADIFGRALCMVGIGQLRVDQFVASEQSADCARVADVKSVVLGDVTILHPACATIVSCPGCGQ
jgi:hypothetical protein